MPTGLLRLVVLFSFWVFLPAKAIAENLAQDYPNDACPLYRAHYKPHPIYDKFNDDYRFAMAILKSGRKQFTSGPEPLFYYQITMSDRRSGERLSQMSLGLSCTMGVGVCSASAGDDPRMGIGVSLEVLELNRDLSPYWLTVPREQNAYEYSAPYAVVFSHAAAWFFRLDWSRIGSDVIYFTQPPVHPNIKGRDVWVYAGCEDETASEQAGKSGASEK